MLTMKKSLKHSMATALTLALVIAMATVGFAAGGNGSGKGAAKGEALELVNCSIKDNESGVALNLGANLEFSKNVVNISVAENNKKCFSLKDSAGNNVALSVIMGDDQLDPNCKILVELKADGLKSNEKYILTIGADIVSKSGEKLSNDVVINFSTVAEGIASEPVKTGAYDVQPLLLTVLTVISMGYVFVSLRKVRA